MNNNKKQMIRSHQLCPIERPKGESFSTINTIQVEELDSRNNIAKSCLNQVINHCPIKALRQRTHFFLRRLSFWPKVLPLSLSSF